MYTAIATRAISTVFVVLSFNDSRLFTFSCVSYFVNEYLRWRAEKPLMITHEISGCNCKWLALWMTPVHVKLVYRIVSYRMSVCHPSKLVLRLKSPRAGNFANMPSDFIFQPLAFETHVATHISKKQFLCVVVWHFRRHQESFLSYGRISILVQREIFSRRHKDLQSLLIFIRSSADHLF